MQQNHELHSAIVNSLVASSDFSSSPLRTADIEQQSVTKTMNGSNIPLNTVGSELNQAMSAITVFERHISCHRMEISRHTNRLGAERTVIAKSIETLRRMETEDIKTRMFRDFNNNVERSDQQELINNFMFKFPEIEQRFIELLNRMSQKYPMYQIDRAETIGDAIDILVSTVEICLEDVNLLKATLASTEHETRNLVNKNQELKAQIEQKEAALLQRANSLKYRGTYTEGLMSRQPEEQSQQPQQSRPQQSQQEPQQYSAEDWHQGHYRLFQAQEPTTEVRQAAHNARRNRARNVFRLHLDSLRNRY